MSKLYILKAQLTTILPMAFDFAGGEFQLDGYFIVQQEPLERQFFEHVYNGMCASIGDGSSEGNQYLISEVFEAIGAKIIPDFSSGYPSYIVRPKSIEIT